MLSSIPRDNQAIYLLNDPHSCLLQWHQREGLSFTDYYKSVGTVTASIFYFIWNVRLTIVFRAALYVLQLQLCTARFSIHLVDLQFHRCRYKAQWERKKARENLNCATSRWKKALKQEFLLSSMLSRQTTAGLYYKSFTIVIYDLNDNGKCYTTFMAVSYYFCY
jgi:hypothetical protein